MLCPPLPSPKSFLINFFFPHLSIKVQHEWGWPSPRPAVQLMETSLALVKKGAKEVVALFLLCSPSFFFSFQFQCIWGQQAGKQLVPQGCCCIAWMATGSSCTTLGNCNPTVKSLYLYCNAVCSASWGITLHVASECYRNHLQQPKGL